MAQDILEALAGWFERAGARRVGRAPHCRLAFSSAPLLVIAAKSSNRQQICQRLRGSFSHKFWTVGIRLTSAIPIDQPIARARAIRIVSCNNACGRTVISIQLEPA